MRWLDLIRPRISRAEVAQLALITVAGALIAGVYGIVHDQLTYSLSREYFTRFKFNQFAAYEPAGASPRVFAGLIGFLATWWVGAIVAWGIGRGELWRTGTLPSRKNLGLAFAIVWTGSVIGAAIGWGWAQVRAASGFAETWTDWTKSLGVTDPIAFLSVGFIHNGSYLGGVGGTFAAILYLRLIRKSGGLQRTETRPS